MTRANEPAHPINAETFHYPGLTIREYLAATAMQGLIALESLGTVLAIMRAATDGAWPVDESSPLERTVRNAVKYADALLAELEKGK